jgi:hypothetical protein
MDEGYILRENERKVSKGLHGYDNDLESVRCIFIGIIEYFFIWFKFLKN